MTKRFIGTILVLFVAGLATIGCKDVTTGRQNQSMQLTATAPTSPPTQLQPSGFVTGTYDADMDFHSGYGNGPRYWITMTVIKNDDGQHVVYMKRKASDGLGILAAEASVNEKGRIKIFYHVPNGVSRLLELEKNGDGFSGEITSFVPGGGGGHRTVPISFSSRAS